MTNESITSWNYHCPCRTPERAKVAYEDVDKPQPVKIIHRLKVPSQTMSRATNRQKAGMTKQSGSVQGHTYSDLVRTPALCSLYLITAAKYEDT